MHLARKFTAFVFSTFLFIGFSDAQTSVAARTGTGAIDPSKRRADVTDIDGNVYQTVQIGRQVWMAENLRTTRYRNGDAIPYARRDRAWTTKTVGMRCTYEHDDALADRYGQLYNFFAVQDERGLCPSGWHVPSDAEWTALTDALGGEAVAGKKMKSTAWGGSNSSGFSALPGGFRNDFYGSFSYEGFGGWWSSSAYGTSNAWSRYLDSFDDYVLRLNYSRRYGFSVRCVRDE
jgi:uncharacterized protein (TIGR02145 family)